jgi:hypothetical protein
VPILLFRLLMTPVFIGLVTLAGRRWGPRVSGLLMGLPLTSGPISVFLLLQYGQPFAARAAVANLAGMASCCMFCLAYGLAARKGPWTLCVLAGFLAFAGATALLDQHSWSLAQAGILVLAAILGVLRLLPRQRAVALPAPSRWDLPARMLTATAFVVALTTLARSLGPQLSGLISPFPVYGLIMASFTQRHGGPGAVLDLLRGNVAGGLAFLAFFLVAGWGLQGHGPAAGVYLAASAASVLVSWAAFRASRAQLRVA